MTFPITSQAALELTSRWHDQILDVEALKFDEQNQRCVFTVTEEKPGGPVTRPMPLVAEKPLQHCCVTVKNVTRVEIFDAVGEVELFIDEVEATPKGLRVKGMNGTLELIGDRLEASIEVVDAGESQVTFGGIFGGVTWRRKRS
jgi:hypothetical protein